MEILVPTSNRYIHCLPGFAYLFNKFWPTDQRVTVMCYEKMPKDLPRNFDVIQIGKQVDYTWSSGLVKGIEYLLDEPFILMLEDYFLDRRVDVGYIQLLYEHLAKADRVVKIDLTNDRQKLPHLPYRKIPNGILSDYNTGYQASVQAAIWDKKFILRFLDPTEGPWKWEKNGTRRIIRARCEGWSGDILGTTLHPVHYVNAICGEGNHPQKWARKRFPDWLWNELREKGLL